MRLVLLSLLLVCVAAMSVGGQETPRLVANRISIEAGESTLLSWKSDADAAFLSGVGKVNPTGEVVVKPEVTTRYVLVTEKARAIHYASVQIKVQGTKGDTFFPDPDEFRQGVRGQGSADSYPDFLWFVFKTLQDKLGFKVRGDFLPGRNFSLLFTDRRERQNLLTEKDAEAGVQQRRISYAVQVHEPDAKARRKVIHFEVKTIIDYKRAADRWKPETNQEIARRAEEALKLELEKAPGK